MHITLITIIGMVLIFIIPMILITLFGKVDTDISYSITPTKRDIIIIAITSISISLIQWLIIGNNVNNHYLHSSILMGYLLFMSYTDQKTTLLYSIISYAMIVIELITILISYGSLTINKYSMLVFIIPVLLFIMSIFRWIGFGDVLIYLVISLFSMQYSILPVFNVGLNLVLAMFMFLLINILKNIKSQDKERHRPFTVYIAISTFLCNSFLV